MRKNQHVETANKQILCRQEKKCNFRIKSFYKAFRVLILIGVFFLCSGLIVKNPACASDNANKLEKSNKDNREEKINKIDQKEKKLFFEKKIVTIEKHKIKVEIADTDERHQLGLMFRSKLDADAGMLFIFQNEAPRSFWMKNTFIPLDIGFFDRNKVLIDIQTMEPTASMMEENPPSYFSAGPAQFALEVRKEWFKNNKIKVGAKFSLDAISK